MSYAVNVQQGKSSDIFNTNPDTSSVAITPSKIRDSNKSTNFISWNVADSEVKKPVRANPTQKSSIFTDGPIESKSVRTYQNKDTLVLGTEDTSSFNVKKDKTKTYDPEKYLKSSTAYERSLKQFYGDDEKYKTNNLKSSIGALTTELNPKENQRFTEGNAKERKTYMLYGEKGTNNNNSTTKPEPIMSKNSANAQITAEKDGINNQVDSLKSNIFFNKDFEKRNKEIFATKPEEPQESIVEKVTPTKTNRKKAENVYYAKLDWKDPKTSLMYRNKDNMNDTAHDRKLNDLFGRKDSHPKQMQEPDMQLRNEIEKNYHSEHPKEKECKIKKQMENVSTIIDTKQIYDPIKVKYAERLCQNYEVGNFTHYNDVNVDKVAQVLKSKGMHIFNTKTDESYHDGKTIGKISFSIRGINDDNNYQAKLDQAKEEIKIETGLDILPANPVKRKVA